jgi:transposase InsO family protein
MEAHSTCGSASVRHIRAPDASESFFGSLKNEWYHRFSFETRSKARMAVIWYIESFYNRTRPHSSVGWRKPAELMDEFFARFDRGLEEVQMAA